MSQVTYLEIAAETAGQRIDNFLHTYFKGVPKSHVYRILRTGEVRVNKGRIKPTYRLQAGDIVRLPPVNQAQREPAMPSALALQQLREAVVYQDKQLLVINKPVGMAVHGGSGVSYGVIEGLRALYPEAPYLELVHRLDRDTSGCLMIAKKASMLRLLHQGLQDKEQISKSYLALVQGQWSARQKYVDAPLQKNTLQSGERVVRVSDTGKAALSQFQVIQRYADATLVRVQLITGRTHQIRVHSAYANHPLAGDNKYGNVEFNRICKDLGLKRLFLHAVTLELRLPDRAPLRFDAPLPVELEQFLTRLPKSKF